MNYVIGVNFACKNVIAGLFAENGQQIAKTAVTVPSQKRNDGREQYAPEDWAEACFAAIRETMEKSGVDGADVRAIATAGHNSELIFLAEDGKPLCPTIVGRGVKYPQEDREAAAIPRLREWTGNEVLRENLVSKILWYRKNEGELFSRVKTILYGKDWLLYRLTGVLSCDVTTASYSQLFDVKARRWSREMFETLSLPDDIVPPVHESRELISTLTAEASEKTGLPRTVACCAGLTNKACIELASLAVDEGDDIYTLNLTGNIITHATKPYTGPEEKLHTFCSAIRDEYMVLTDTASAFSALQWFASAFCPNLYAGGREAADFKGLEALAAKAAPGSDGVVFLPYIKGELVPYQDKKARGVFFGIGDKTTGADMLRAVTEGIACSTVDCIDFMHEKLGVPHGGLRFRSMGDPDYWMQLVADTADRSTVFIQPKDGSITGASVLAATAAGLYPDERTASKAMIPEGKVYTPGTAAEGCRRAYATYKRLYPALKELY